MATSKKTSSKTNTKSKTSTKTKTKTSVKNSTAKILSDNTSLTSSQSKKIVNVASKVENKLHPATFIILIVCLLIGIAGGYFIATSFIFKSACNILLGGIL